MPHPEPAALSSRPIAQLKVVYYGPSGVGKTTTLRRLAARLSAAGRLFTLDTQGLRTLYFDALPVVLSCGDQRVLLRLVSVPGSPMHRPMRRLLLRGADGVVLVQRGTDRETPASSTQPAASYGQTSAEASFDELRGNLRECGMTAASVPVATQESPWPPAADADLLRALRSVLRAAWTASLRRMDADSGSDLPTADQLDAALLQAFDLPESDQVSREPVPSVRQATTRCEAQPVPCGPQSLALLWNAEARSAGRAQTGGASRS